MAHGLRATARVAAVIALSLVGCVGCESGGSVPAGEPVSGGAGLIPLARLEGIHVDGGLPADVEGPSSVLAELRYGHGRLIAYVQGDCCAIVATPEGDGGAGAVPVRLVAKQPRGGEGSSRLPAGPYNSASVAGGPRTWASLLCGENAMVIEYASGGEDVPQQVRGSVAVTRTGGGPATSRIIVGDPAARRLIEERIGTGQGPPVTNDQQTQNGADMGSTTGDRGDRSAGGPRDALVGERVRLEPLAHRHHDGLRPTATPAGSTPPSASSSGRAT